MPDLFSSLCQNQGGRKGV